MTKESPGRSDIEGHMEEFRKSLAGTLGKRALEDSQMRYQLLVDMSEPEDERVKVRYLLQVEVDELERKGELDQDGSHRACGLFDTEEEVEAMIIKLQRDFEAVEPSRH